eukprot:Plantae.Rhodophyta-Purpureofilum_apyrenoidigerum.ctg6489.p1 GENE.Plantae.Rhodophyta-Purpureofilum_apyrenoidigerum.ctg6489~~Plantae.Rhodophyta-Purpureofilum_apyrenoidigerum.ctg6489.p1  ORF type:complete len:224 (-),score=29.07 Plantae.Rhodophyta-Purpureofilum_apyrenoidigerum.ctg6489:317-988(-)
MYAFLSEGLGRPWRGTTNRVACRWRASAGSRGSRLALVGLGNPGDEFRNTRHNIGFEIADAYTVRHGGNASSAPKFFSEVSEVQVAGTTVMIVKPMTYMNLSGTAVRKVIDFYKMPTDAVLVVADDIYLELGRVRLRAKGSAGGHNGLRHIEKSLGTQIYPRLKVGVGSPDQVRLRDYVLGKFKRSEEDLVEKVVWDCMDVLDAWVKEPDLSKIMNALSKSKS